MSVARIPIRYTACKVGSGWALLVSNASLQIYKTEMRKENTYAKYHMTHHIKALGRGRWDSGVLVHPLAGLSHRLASTSAVSMSRSPCHSVSPGPRGGVGPDSSPEAASWGYLAWDALPCAQAKGATAPWAWGPRVFVGPSRLGWHM